MVFLQGCQTIQEQVCNTNAAYNVGVNDAINGRDMQTNYASICPKNKAAINEAYQNGYKYGLSTKPTKETVIIEKHQHKDDGDWPQTN